MKAAGVAVVARTTIPPKLVTIETIGAGVENVLELLDREGGDVTGHLAITVGGDHPSFPGVTVIEAKAQRRKPAAAHADDCDPRCPIDHSLDSADDESEIFDRCTERREEWRVQEEYAMSLSPGNRERAEILRVIAEAKRAHPECIG